MRALRSVGKWFWRFMVIFSFIVNIILVVVLAVLLLTIFDIKANIAQPLIEGLHSSFVGLNDATIDWTIPVRTSIDVTDKTITVDDSILLDKDTIVTLTDNVYLNVTANITLPGVGNLNNAQVALALPKDLQLPVHLSLDVPILIDVPVNLEDIPVDLDVRAVIPLSQTQLHDPVENLRLLFEPIVRILGNLPGDFSEVGPFVGNVVSGNTPNLLAETQYSQNPWPGFSTTAGLNYDMANVPVPPENVPALTGIQATGGIPALDQGIRPELYQSGDPLTVNAQAVQGAQAQGIAPQYYDGTYSDYAGSPLKQALTASQGAGTSPDTPPPVEGGQQPPVQPGNGGQSGVTITPTPSEDLGILPPGG
ncbi:MAG: hypothetical protein K8L97_15020 [Anaerolineae bacterium]|nr:hypothetical protein [Anaerolineae bacterium]